MIKKSLSLYLYFILLLSSTLLIMTDGEIKVLTAEDVISQHVISTLLYSIIIDYFVYIVVRRRPRPRRHHHLRRRRRLHHLLGPWRVVGWTDLLWPLPTYGQHCIGVVVINQVGRSSTMPTALRGIYLLITALHGKWSRSIWHQNQGLTMCSGHRAGRLISNLLLIDHEGRT